MNKKRCNITVPFEIKECEVIKAENGEEFFHFKGYASTFGNIDKALDVVVEGAFKNSLAQHQAKNLDFPALWQHDTHMPVGVYPVVDMFEDSKGLFVHGILPLEDTFVSGRVKPQMKVGSVRKMSIGFNIIEATDEKDAESQRWIRFIKEADLMEISLVTFACNDEANVTEVKNNKIEVKKMFDEAKTLSDIEKIFEEKGFSQSEAKAAISKIDEIKKDQRDAVAQKELEEKSQRDADEAKKALEGLTKSLDTYNTKLKEA